MHAYNAARLLKSILQYFTMLLGLFLAIGLIFYRESHPLSPADSTAFVEDNAENAEPNEEEEPQRSILIPHCNDIHYDIAKKTNDFSFRNPEENDCLLRVTLNRRDTGEAFYISPLLGAGNKVENVTFFQSFSSAGNYAAMVKIDAYKPNFGTHALVNSMVIDVTVCAE